MLSRIFNRARNRVDWLRLPPVVREVKRQRLSYLSAAKFFSLRKVIREIERQGLSGDVVEYGIALGGSAVYLASECYKRRRFHGYDVFGMIPAPGEQDDQKSKARYDLIRSGRSKGLGDDVYYGYQDNLFDRVCDTFKSFGMPADGVNIALHRGLFESTVKFSPEDKVVLAHLDCDWYDPVRLCLERTYEVLQRGGFMILDDYNDYGGARKATDEFLALHPQLTLVRTLPHAIIQRQ